MGEASISLHAPYLLISSFKVLYDAMVEEHHIKQIVLKLSQIL